MFFAQTPDLLSLPHYFPFFFFFSWRYLFVLLSSQLPSPVWCSRRLHLPTMQLCSFCVLSLLCMKSLWWYLRSFWLVSSMKWRLWTGVSSISSLFCEDTEHLLWVRDGGWLFCPQIWEETVFLLTWAFNDLPGNPAGITSFHTQPQAKTSHHAGWCHLQPSGTAWTVGVPLYHCSNSGCLHGTPHLLKEGPYNPNTSHCGQQESGWGAGLGETMGRWPRDTPWNPSCVHITWRWVWVCVWPSQRSTDETSFQYIIKGERSQLEYPVH